jgi:hypothetical protein
MVLLEMVKAKTVTAMIMAQQMEVGMMAGNYFK